MDTAMYRSDGHDASTPATARRPAAGDAPPLAVLFARMRSPDHEVADEAWGEVYRRYRDRVWARVYYVIRTVPWLREAREVATDVTTQVFVGLPAAVARYQDQGKAEQWLLRVALRTALRHRESLTGNWSGRKPASGGGAAPTRSYLDLDDAVHQIYDLMDETERDERLELRRRLDAWRKDPGKEKWLALIDLFLEGYSHDEIAERLGITSGTSRTWMWKIRQQLAEAPAAGTMNDEVAGRAAWPTDGVRPIRPGAEAHLGAELLADFADGLLDADADAAGVAHLRACAACTEQVDAARRGLARLMLLSEPPADLFERALASRAAGDQPLLAVAPEDAAVALLDEVAGRDAGEPDPGNLADPGSAGRSSDGGRVPPTPRNGEASEP
jgi:RNA polymerase sigma factor (sigma-70 family)